MTSSQSCTETVTQQRQSKEIVLESRYRVRELLEKGNGLWTFTGEDINENDAALLVQFEAFTAPRHVLAKQRDFYSTVSSPHVSKFYYFGPYLNRYEVLVTEDVGPTLEDLRIACGGHFTLETVLLLGTQMLKAVEELHKCDFIHCAIGPDSFCVGRGAKLNTVMLTNLTHVEKFRENDAHRPMEMNCSLAGSFAFASNRALEGIRQSRRDDVESVVEVLLFLLKGSSPWSDTPCGSPQEHLMKKTGRTLEEALAEFPPFFVDFLKHCRQLDYDTPPDYALLCHRLAMEYSKMKPKKREFDWVTERKIYLEESAEDPPTPPISVRYVTLKNEIEA